MFFVLSPAKNLNEKDPSPVSSFTLPDLLPEAEILMQELRQLAPQQIAELMHVSDKIALLNAERNAVWHTPFTPENAKQAVFMFNGDVYEASPPIHSSRNKSTTCNNTSACSPAYTAYCARST